MKSNHSAILASLMLLSITQTAWAVMPSNEIRAGAAPVATANATTQRGGKITAIDTSQHTLSVDKVRYSLQTTSIPIHTANPPYHGNQTNLAVGTLIRFNTIKQGFSGNEVINEIWITSTKTSSPQK